MNLKLVCGRLRPQAGGESSEDAWVAVPTCAGTCSRNTSVHHSNTDLRIFQCDIDDITTYDPPLEQRMKWVDGTDTPYDPFEAMRTMQTREIACPQCQKTQTIRMHS